MAEKHITLDNLKKLSTLIKDYIQNFVHNGTLTIKQNDEVVGTFSANASSDSVIELLSGGTGGVEITWDEYNALSDEEKNSDTVYYIKDTPSTTNSPLMDVNELSSSTPVDEDNFLFVTSDSAKKVTLSELKDIFGQNVPIGNGTLTIKKNGVTIGTFSANAEDNTEINIEADSIDYATNAEIISMMESVRNIELLDILGQIVSNEIVLNESLPSGEYKVYYADMNGDVLDGYSEVSVEVK